MPAVRALPIHQLMPAVSSCKAPAATRVWVDAPERMSGRTHHQPAPPGTPSIIMSPDHRPWTQIRLAPARHSASNRPIAAGRRHMT